MAKFARTPELSIKEEALRQKVLSELTTVNLMFNSTVVADILLKVVDTDYVTSARKWVEQGDGSVLRFFRKIGVRIRQSGRRFLVRDHAGEFEFTDDYFYSGINFLLRKYADFFKMPFGIFDVSRVPNSLKSLMGVYWDETKEHSGALSYLVSLHETGKYDMSKFQLRMQGGNFAYLRPLVISVEQEPDSPVYTPGPKIRQKLSGKMLDLCVSGATRVEWADMMVSVFKNGVDNSLVEVLVKNGDTFLANNIRKKMVQLLSDLMVAAPLDSYVFEKLYVFFATYGLDAGGMTSIVLRFREHFKMLYQRPIRGKIKK